MRKYEKLAADIVKNVGGKSNVSSLQHCVTRLRFSLVDESKANDEVLKNMDGVVSVVKNGGQYQVVIGNHVPEVYKEVNEILGFSESVSNNTNNNQKKTMGAKILDLVGGIFTPILPVLCASGIIKGLNQLLLFLQVYPKDSGIAILLSAIGDAVFFFLPIILGYTSANKLGLKPQLGLVIGACLAYPTLNGAEVNLFGHVINATYTSTVLPVILVVALSVPLEKFFDRVVPVAVRTFVSPMLVLLISVPLGFVFIGPVANQVASGIGSGLSAAYSFSPILAGLIIGGLWQVLVVFGLHGPVVMLSVVNILGGNPDPIYGIMGGTSFSVTAVIFAIWLKTKNKKMKSVSLPAAISAFFGVTEPGLYGILLPKIKFFVITCIGGGITGIFFGIFHTLAYQMAGMGIFRITAYLEPGNEGESLTNLFISLAAGMAVAFITTYILYKDDEQTNEQETKRTDINDKEEVILSPLTGKVNPLSTCRDEAFAKGLLGNGVVITPSKGEVKAPFDGEIVTLFPTKHALGIRSNNGCEVLIHVGIDTVNLGGKHFNSQVQQGDIVKQGEVLLTFDIQGIEKEGFSTETPIIITNSPDYSKFDLSKEEQIVQSQKLIVAYI